MRWAIPILFLLLASGALAYIVDPASTGFNSQNRTENGKNMTRNWLFNNASILVTGNNSIKYLAVPWFDTGDSTNLTNVDGSSDLHNCQNSSYTPGYSNQSFCVVTDEFSRAAYALAFYQNNDTIADAIINTVVVMNDTGNTYGSRSGSNLTEWVTYWNYSTSLGYWEIKKDQVADTATDADAYAILTLSHINHSVMYNSTNRQRAGTVGSGMCLTFVANEFFDADSLSLKNRVNPGQTVRYWPCGGSSVCSAITNNDVTYQAYYGPVLEALAACKVWHGDTGAYNYSKVAEDTFQAHLISANWTGTTFALGQGRSMKWNNASTNGMPWASCTTTCTSGGFTLGTEWPDALRVTNICRATWAWSNFTSRTLQNSSTYCQQFASKDCVGGNTYGYDMANNGTNYNTCADGGFRAVGIGMSLFFSFNQTNMSSMITQYNSHYGTCTGPNGLCEMDSQHSFGVYDKSFGLTDEAYAIGLADGIFSGVVADPDCSVGYLTNTSTWHCTLTTCYFTDSTCNYTQPYTTTTYTCTSSGCA